MASRPCRAWPSATRRREGRPLKARQLRMTRLFFYGPFALSVFLGQQPTSIGQLQLFEYQDPGYVPSCLLRTGRLPWNGATRALLWSPVHLTSRVNLETRAISGHVLSSKTSADAPTRSVRVAPRLGGEVKEFWTWSRHATTRARNYATFPG